MQNVQFSAVPFFCELPVPDVGNKKERDVTAVSRIPALYRGACSK